MRTCLDWFSRRAWAVAALIAMLVDGACAHAQARQQAMRYEVQETAIYQAVLSHLLAEWRSRPDHPRPAICLDPAATSPPPALYRTDLLEGTDDPATRRHRRAPSLGHRYNQIASRYLRGPVRVPAVDRDLSADGPGGTLGIANVALSECDDLLQFSLRRPSLHGSVGFLSVTEYDGCSSSWRRFAVVQRRGRWSVEGYRQDPTVDSMGCTATQRRRSRLRPDHSRAIIVTGADILSANQ